MLMFTGTIVLSVFAWAVLRMFYGFAVIPALRDKARFELYAVRDELRAMAIAGEIDPTSFSFNYFENVLNAMTRLCAVHSVSRLIYFAAHLDEVPQERIDERARFNSEAPQHLKALESRSMKTMMRVMFANSPLFCVFALIASFVYGAIRQTIELKNVLMWHFTADRTNSLGNGAGIFRKVAHR
jgi:hypothetical protein